jgi:hypothetical protein
MCKSIKCARNTNAKDTLEMWASYLIEQAQYAEPGDELLDRADELTDRDRLFTQSFEDMQALGIDVFGLATCLANKVLDGHQIASMLVNLEVADINTAIGYSLEDAGLEALTEDDIDGVFAASGDGVCRCTEVPFRVSEVVVARVGGIASSAAV